VLLDACRGAVLPAGVCGSCAADGDSRPDRAAMEIGWRDAVGASSGSPAVQAWAGRAARPVTIRVRSRSWAVAAGTAGAEHDRSTSTRHSEPTRGATRRSGETPPCADRARRWVGSLRAFCAGFTRTVSCSSPPIRTSFGVAQLVEHDLVKRRQRPLGAFLLSSARSARRLHAVIESGTRHFAKGRSIGHGGGIQDCAAHGRYALRPKA
jgi:hypothetical protein